ncbi:MAG: hypothetical protein RL078_580 [Bacteroidota bacterium]
MQLSTEIVNPPAHSSSNSMAVFSNITAFEDAQRMAKALITSSLVPEEFKGPEKLGNAMIALELANRIGASPIAVMQNIHIIHGRPSWSASFIIAALNSCGRFSPLRFTIEKSDKDTTCFAWAYDKTTNDILEGPRVSISMAKEEGWIDKKGSKWRTMPELMLRYRAAAFFGRLYAPDVLSGMSTADEAQDIKQEARASRVRDLTKIVLAEDKQETTNSEWE